MCFFDVDGPQKYTSVLILKSLAPAAAAFQRPRCCHDKHKEVAVGLEHSRASQVDLISIMSARLCDQVNIMGIFMVDFLSTPGWPHSEYPSLAPRCGPRC